MTSRPSQMPGSRRVLIVDDDDRIRELLCGYLALHGFDAHGADNGLSALDLLNNSRKNFDIIVTDHEMPQMGGIELVRTIRHRFPSRTIIGMSGLVDTEKDFMDAGANGFFSKPFELQEILSTLAAMSPSGGEGV